MRAFIIAAFAAVVALAPTADAVAQYGFHFGRNKIQYETFDWQILRTEHFDVYHYPEMRTLAEQAARFAEEAYDELQQRFATSLTHRVPLILYSTNLHFRQTNVTPGFIPDGVGGFFEFMKGRVVVPANGDLHRFRRVIRHEVVHVFTYDRVGSVLRDHRLPLDRFVPLWFTEGLAEFWSGERDHQHEMVMRDAVFSNYLLPLDNLHRVSGTYFMYKQGEAVMHFLAERYGEEIILRLIDNLWLDRDFGRVLEYTTGEAQDAINGAWLRWVSERYYPDFPRVDAPSRIARSVSTSGYAAKPVHYRDAQGRRWVLYIGNRTGYTNVYRIEVDSLLAPHGTPEVLVRGERTDAMETLPAFDSRISVTRDGRLAFVARSGGQDVIHVYDASDGSHHVTLRFDTVVSISSPDWSPDGDRIVFAGIDRSGYRNLYATTASTGSLEALTEDAFDDRDPAWAPDGRSIVFASDRSTRGREGAYHLHYLDLASRRIERLTDGGGVDQSPRFSVDGSSVVFSRSQPDSSGRFGAQDLWMLALEKAGENETNAGRRLTALTTAAFDPIPVDEGRLLFSTFERGRFSIRSMTIEREQPIEERRFVRTQSAERTWSFAPIDSADVRSAEPYRRRYSLDLAQGAISQTPVWGTTSGAMLAFSDMLGDHHYFVTLYNSSYGGGSFLQNLNASLARYHLQRRVNIGYGAFRFGGLRYDITDPDAVSAYPLLRESIYGGFGALIYPISQFRRIEFGASASWNEKEVAFREIERSAALLSGSVSLVHDHTLYGMNGPLDGARANLTIGYTRDVAFRNVDYVTLTADARRYFRLAPDVTFASWGLFRMNHGREARLWYLGGSWDLRGWRFYDVRGSKMWFTSHELRFPIATAPHLFIPMLQPFGVANLRAALFLDAAHAWTDAYHRREAHLRTGETLGAAGLGLRVNVFGGLVLRYDIGYRYRDGFREREHLFRQFFFGYDF